MSKLRNRARAASHANLVALPVAAFLSREILRRCYNAHLNICWILRIGLSDYNAASIFLSIFTALLISSGLTSSDCLSLLFFSLLFSPLLFFPLHFHVSHLCIGLDWTVLQCEGDPWKRIHSQGHKARLVIASHHISVLRIFVFIITSLSSSINEFLHFCLSCSH